MPETTETPTPYARQAARRAEAIDAGRMRAPQDRRPKAKRDAAPSEITPVPDGPMEITYHGYTYTVFPAVLDDWETMERLKANASDPANADDDADEVLLVELFGGGQDGEDGVAELRENIREKYGRVSLQVFGGFLQHVMRTAFRGN